MTSTDHASSGVILQNLTASSTDRVQTWIDQPNFRGTYDIIWTCLATIFICTYTLLCLNVPGSRDSEWKVFRRRVMWMLLAITGPEFVLQYAAGQWSRACQSVEAFHSAGYADWTMRQAFYADMGGFVLHAEDSDPFPLNAKHLHWLVVNKYVVYPELSTQEIWDKSKQDRIAKFISAFQIGYLLLQCVGRAAQGLAITTLELNTIAIVVCSLATIMAWYHKPGDVRTPTRVYSHVKMRDIVGSAKWNLTPLDFVDENGPSYSGNVQSFIGLPTIPSERPIQHIPNDRFPTNPYGSQEYCLCVATLLFTGIHLAAWNWSFPSKTEQILWRVASMLLFGITAAFWVLETMASWVRLGRWKWLYRKIVSGEERQRPAMQEKTATLDSYHLEKMTREYEPTVLPLPWEFWTIFPLAMLYGIGRLYLVVEAFLELRNVEATAYVNVNWSVYIPHIGSL